MKISKMAWGRSQAAFALATLCGILKFAAGDEGRTKCSNTKNNTVYDFSFPNVQGNEIMDLADYRGEVLLVVNVATFCGLTLQYHGLNALQDKYRNDGFRVLGVPCNQFGYQEPAATSEELMNGLKYARPGHGFVPNFNLTKKTNVNGQKEHQLFTYMKSVCPTAANRFRQPILYEPIYTSDVRWNFEKFLIGRDGRPVHRYASSIDPRTSQMLDEDIAAEIKKTIHADSLDIGKTDIVFD